MVTIIHTIEVKSFSNWKQAFEGDTENRERAGINVRNVYRDVDNHNKVTVVSEVVDVETGRAFMANLNPMIEKSGMALGKPEFSMLEHI